MALRLLFYTHGLVGGGAERVWALLATAFHRRGVEVTFAVDFEAADNLPYLDPDIPLVVLGRGHARASLRLAKLIEQTRPHVSFAAVGASDLKLLAASFLSSWRTRLVLSVHGGLEYEEHVLGRLRFRALPLTTRMAERTVVVSEDLRGIVINRYFADPATTVAVKNPIALPPLASVPTAAELASRPNTVLAVCRLVQQKDVGTLVRAFAASRLAERLVILGDGPERPALEALVRDLGVARRVEFVGYVREPWPWFQRAKMFAHASTSEAFGNVVVEALSFGLPMVVTATGGPSEILEWGAHGRLVPVGDHAAFARAIDQTLADPGDPASRRARAELYDLETVADGYQDIVNELLGRARRPLELPLDVTRSA
jgi:glycosyltransferase involved in cell wall biosynthesis